MLRRYDGEARTSELIRSGDLTIDLESRVTQVNGKTVDLTPLEFEILTILITSAGRVFTRNELLNRLRNDSFERIERTIDVHIRNLRAKIEKQPAHPKYIRTVFGVGYRFNDKDY